MSKYKKQTDTTIIEVAKKAKTMSEAAATLHMHFNTFKRHALRLNVYVPNQSGKGIRKKSGTKIPLCDILEGKHPSYQSNKLRIRLIEEGIKLHKCEACGLREWQGKHISLELDHINGKRTDHTLSNLRVLCPNCHSQTSTYRGKNITF
jgi:5-methylcytosine-specific restriction endonuclease McrA